MRLNTYQEEAKRTVKFPKEQGITYCSLGLASEAGEVAGKVKKVIRDNSGVFAPDLCEKIAHELGDCLWYVAVLADQLGYDLESLAKKNCEKLSSRMDRGVIQGSGDDR